MGLIDDLAPDQKQCLYSGGDGSTIDKAVVINVESTSIGIPAEYEYISKLYGQQNVGWTVIRQSLMVHDVNHYDVLLIKLSNGDEKSIYFDITQFYGKF
jgi:hypothetical protein